jgi:hypothetical protein
VFKVENGGSELDIPYFGHHGSGFQEVVAPSALAVDSARITLVLFRRRALSEQCGAEQRIGRAFEKAVRRKPLARRTRALCNLNGTRERC